MKLKSTNNKWVTLLKVAGLLAVLSFFITKCSTDTSSDNKPNSIERHFSKFDGSYIKFRNYIKDNLNDPKSFEHVETRFTEHNDGTATVWMKYIGNNAFNATLTKIAKCTLDINTGDFSNVITD